VFDIVMRESQINCMTMRLGETASNLGSAAGRILMLMVVLIGVRATDRNGISSILEVKVCLFVAAS
jgi:hypothetical protein